MATSRSNTPPKSTRPLPAGPVVIEDMAQGGHGIARIDGEVCLVPNALPQDKIVLKSLYEKRGVLWGEIGEIRRSGIARIKRTCHCGGCSWQHFSYPSQGKWKKRILQQTFQRIGGIEHSIDWVDAPLKLRQGWRTRVTVQSTPQGFGFFQPGTHTITQKPDCPLIHKNLRAVLDQLCKKPPRHGPTTITVNPEGSEVLIWRTEHDSGLHRFGEYNYYRDKAPRKQFLFDGVPIVNGCFSQASLELNRLLVSKVKELTGPYDTILDLYCGSGNLSLGLPAAKKVTGIDHSKSAIQAAAHRKKHTYVDGNESVMNRHLRSVKNGMVILDPPRTGAKAIVDSLAQSKAEAVCYCSCDAPTIARDVKQLVRAGFSLQKLAGIDMYPHTSHFEIIALLTRS